MANEIEFVGGTTALTDEVIALVTAASDVKTDGAGSTAY